MFYIIIVMAFITVYLLCYTALDYFYKTQKTVDIRLNSISAGSLNEKDNELNQPLFVRFIRPILEDVSRTVMKMTPKELIALLEKKVVTAGRPFNLSVKDWINLQVAFVLFLPVSTIIIGIYRRFEPRNILFAVIVEVGLGLVLPNLLLSKKVSDRQIKIVNSLPDVLDLLTVSVEAGLGFDGALAKVIDKMPGPLADEFDNVLQEMKVGKQKRDALKGMSERINVQDLTTFINSVIQADQLGVSMGNVLRIQSEQIRQKRKQRAQEKAMKAPVKMLIPMVLFIFPTIFSVLIGPVAIKLIATFTK